MSLRAGSWSGGPKGGLKCIENEKGVIYYRRIDCGDVIIRAKKISVGALGG